MSGKNFSLHIKAQCFTCVDVHLRLSCVSFKEVSQADETYNSGADGNLTKASEQLLLSQTSRLRSRNAEGVGKKLQMDL